MTPPENGTVGRVTVQVELANPYDIVLADMKRKTPESIRRVAVTALVNTKLARLILPPDIVAQLGLSISGKTMAVYADGRRAEREVANVWLRIQDRWGIYSAVVEPTRNEPSIGFIVMNDLDLLVDCTSQTVVPRDPDTRICEA
jgi:predicted aspartyl protease